MALLPGASAEEYAMLVKAYEQGEQKDFFVLYYSKPVIISPELAVLRVRNDDERERTKFYEPGDDMATESYKKLTIAVIVIFVAGIVVFAVLTSDYKKEGPSNAGAQRGTAPTGPVMGAPPAQMPTEQLGALPDDPKELALLGDRYFESRRYDLAVPVYQKVLEKDPNDIDTYNDLGLALHYTRQSEAAIEVLKKGAQVMPSYQRIWLSLGFILNAVGRNDEAKTAFQKAVELDPMNDVGQEAQKMIASMNKK